MGGRVFLVAICLASLCQAATVEKLNLHTLSQKADFIALGRVVSVETVLEKGEPWTIATLVTESQMKGERKTSVQFRLPGGVQRIGGRTLVTQVEGVPLPNINQRAVVFLTGKDRDRFAIAGLGQCYWRVDIQEGKEVATTSDQPDAPVIELNFLMQRVQRALRELKQQR